MKQKIKHLVHNDKMWIAVLIAVIFLPVLYHFSLIDYDLHHESFLFKTAHDVANGQVLFRETFTQYGALTVYIQALFIKVFGDTIAAVNLSACVALCITYYVMYLIIKKMTNKVIALEGVIISFLSDYVFKDVFHPWSSVYALMALMITVWAWICFIDLGKRYYIIVEGITAALCFWLRQPVGIVVLLACLITTLAYSVFVKPLGFKNLVSFLGSYVSVHAFFIIILFAQNAFHDFYIQSIKGMFQFNSAKNTELTMGKSLKNLLLSLFPKGQLIWCILPTLLLLAFMILFVKLIINKRKKENNKDLVLLASLIVFAIASWHQYYPINDSRHIFWAAVPMIACASIVISKFFKWLGKGNKLPWTACAIIMLGIMFITECVNNVRQGIQKYMMQGERYYNSAYSILNGKYLSEDQAEFQDRLFEVMTELEEAYPDKNVINLTRMSEYAYFSKYNFHPEFYECVVIPYDFWGNAKEYVNQELPIIICYEKDYAYHGFAGYKKYAGIEGNDSNIYWESGSLGIYVPNEIGKIDILPEMRSDTDVERTENEIILHSGEAIYYGSCYFLKDAFKYEVDALIEPEDDSHCILQIYSDWHSELAFETELTVGRNTISLEGGWDNATMYITGLDGSVLIKEVNINCYLENER